MSNSKNKNLAQQCTFQKVWKIANFIIFAGHRRAKSDIIFGEHPKQTFGLSYFVTALPAFINLLLRLLILKTIFFPGKNKSTLKKKFRKCFTIRMFFFEFLMANHENFHMEDKFHWCNFRFSTLL